MTVPKWNAQDFDQRMRGQRPKGRLDPKRLKTVLAIALAGVFLGGAATAGSQVFDDPDPIGICHATGSSENPYVFLVADENSYEHGHHRHHEGDFFREASAGHCEDDVWSDLINETAPDDNSTDADDAGDDPASDGTDTGPDDNSTDGAPADNATDEATADDAPDGAPEESNETAVNETPPTPGDIQVEQWADQGDHRVTLSLFVENVGESDAENVSLTDALPDVRRPWALGGTDAADCTLEGDDLTCWFGTLAPGESVEITLHAYLDRVPCGESMTNTAYGAADGDPEPRNDASSASITARYC